MSDTRIVISQNWDGTCNLTLDGQAMLTRKTRVECEEKAKYLTTWLIINSLPPEKKIDTEPTE